MQTLRLSSLTKVVVGLGIGIGGLAVIPSLLASKLATLVGEMVLGLYWRTSLYLLLQFAAIAWCSRKSVPRLRREGRSSSDATWYLPVYVWGIESNLNVANMFALDGCPGMVGIEQGVMLLVTLGLGLSAERWARRRGCAARADQGALPLPVVAAIISVGIPSLMFAAVQPCGW